MNCLLLSIRVFRQSAIVVCLIFVRYRRSLHYFLHIHNHTASMRLHSQSNHANHTAQTWKHNKGRFGFECLHKRQSHSGQTNYRFISKVATGAIYPPFTLDFTRQLVDLVHISKCKEHEGAVRGERERDIEKHKFHIDGFRYFIYL